MFSNAIDSLLFFLSFLVPTKSIPAKNQTSRILNSSNPIEFVYRSTSSADSESNGSVETLYGSENSQGSIYLSVDDFDVRESAYETHEGEYVTENIEGMRNVSDNVKPRSKLTKYNKSEFQDQFKKASGKNDPISPFGINAEFNCSNIETELFDVHSESLAESDDSLNATVSDFEPPVFSDMNLYCPDIDVECLGESEASVNVDREDVVGPQKSEQELVRYEAKDVETEKKMEENRKNCKRKLEEVEASR